MFPLFLEKKIFCYGQGGKISLWYVSFLYEYFGTTENNNLNVYINVYFQSTVIILQKLHFLYIHNPH